jgi:predicted unusual protein kinase regulating ubiquinone biosynthesis (AarF/ABC1/UbiB family)
VFKGNLVGGMFNADPHPGNYFFHDGGAVTFLDFGCVQPIRGDHLAHARAVHRAAIDRDEAGFRRAAARLLDTRPGRLEQAALDYMRRTFEPLFVQPFRVTRPYAASLMAGMQELKSLAFRSRDEEVFAMPGEMVFMNRLQFGFYSVLARLDAEVDYAAVERGFWSLIT